jgi:hypothetical protein
LIELGVPWIVIISVNFPSVGWPGTFRLNPAAQGSLRRFGSSGRLNEQEVAAPSIVTVRV